MKLTIELRHACDRRSLKTLQENLKLAEERLTETKTRLAKAQDQRDTVKARIKEGNFSLRDTDIER